MSSPSKRPRPNFNTPLMGLILLWIAMLATFAVIIPSFFSWSNFSSILQFSTILALVTLGQTLVILGGGGGIDLSVGGTVSLSGLLLATLLVQGWPVPLAVAACLLLGAGLGAINGLLVTKVQIMPLIVTLGTFYAYNGLALAVTNGAPVRNVPESFSWLGRATWFNIPVHVIVLLVPITLLLTLALTQWPIGRWIYAMGRNERGTRLVGIPVDRVRFGSYVLSGVLAACAAIVATSWLLSARPNIGANLELESLAASLLGGTSIFGGTGSFIGALMGAYFFVTLQMGLQFANINAIWQTGAVGLLLILSVVLDHLSKRRA
jgi:ribose transport system permease protein